MSLTTPPTAPSSLRPTTFAVEMDARLAWQDTNVAEMNVALPIVDAAAAAVAAASISIATQVASAAASAAAAALAAGAATWASGTYIQYACAISPTDSQTYRNKTAGSRTVDPKNDPTNWVSMGAPAALWVNGADIASAGTVNLTTATGDTVQVTGTIAVTAITLADGLERRVRFAGVLTLTNGASLILPGAANITTAAGDVAVFRGFAAGVVRCMSYTKSSGQAVVGSIGDAITALTDGATVNWNTTLGNVSTITLAGNRTIAAPTNLHVGSYVMLVRQDATGSRTLSWNAVFKWAGAAPVLSTAANALDVISLVCDGTYLYGSYLRGVA